MKVIKAGLRRSVSYRDADVAALRAIAQACVNVELFTIPLYMGTMTSIQGMHQVTGKDNDFYQNRLWPGAATTADPDTPNERAFNLIFSVFIEEMLHLQLAANIASAIGVTPCFTSPVLCDDQHGWTCYGPDKTVIPHIIDLADTPHSDVAVTIAALSPQQIELFLAIEEPSDIARSHVKDSAVSKYFPNVPFQGWSADKTEADLPMFGTIDWMYQCYFEYMSLVYLDGKTLWEHVFTAGSQQNDLFNTKDTGHTEAEYPGFRTTITATDAAKALCQAVAMMNAITDQGEGSTLDQRVDPEDQGDVEAKYQPTQDALAVDYPYYSDSGEPEPSADGAARYDNGGIDHYERFTELAELASQVTTWPVWHQRHGPWTPADLQTAPPPNYYGIPSTQAVADAMNRVAAAHDTMYPLVSQAAVGSIAGITTVLNRYWTTAGVVFPYPSMTGSMDRMAICWALYGQPPDLSIGVGDPDTDTLYHGCQSLDRSTRGNNCAAIEVFHCCQGSNACRAQGGCGFVQKIADGGTPGASCGFALVKAKTTGGASGSFSAPSANKCATFGGCAVPMSASQLLVQSGTMQLYDDDSEPFITMEFTEGELAHDVAYRAYLAVMEHRKPSAKPPATPPAPNDLRLVLTPST